MIYTALGDSITFGENASSAAKAYPRLAGSMSCPYRVYVLARPGWSAYDLLDAVIWQGPSLIHRSAVVSVWIGGVDLANAALSALRSRRPLAAKLILSRYKRTLYAILTHIKRSSHARIICCTQYNPFPNSPISIMSIDRLNYATKEVAKSCGATIVPVHTWFEGKQANLIYGYRRGKLEDALSGFLPIHPNDQGHRLIATGLAPYLAA
ncbi:SGNH/GDSL hydrolase family protein [Paenibacillus thiaminolyticus]|uniref:SGNH/GDSL hydrolase family protein n=1 Tax=Paenibacillus thiaminolyticus TaxID=49283 RepID=A0AAP9DX27_PANTH|nr:SGNH/GDSL hydrolase family protein [Paenibacillus thiaminolyticus]MCY9535924.1 SGNH/GDSL hydrolase family protein [Paenibacillus thiaminolyticus]MCY9604266.1 SGNH/GDSL hydrolase family protein [Paenibacillus thiaminolyticus]MCY9608807.1 SGNH/GDSL hydrolase family protein [Paenibacillus thiaminolyticus]MCY9615596.1 SGNH/GDSL hydrolase family protein [Paenibacillus thiaminolyticus]MCY9622203.1 SGNH/GDSL hydrolase family protein [Paenibacillus thiaminolyticus]